MYTIPSVTDFKAYFTRDFMYGSTSDTVMDSDIAKAIDEAGINFNPSFWDTQAAFNMGYLYLTAHYMVMDLRASSQGIAGSYTWLTNSKAVGNVSEGFTIPQKIQDIPSLAMLSKTTYGAKYLSLILPQLIGQCFSASGATSPL